MLAGELEAVHVIALSTDNALSLPLPHPPLFQIHAITSRVSAMKAAVGFPLFARYPFRTLRPKITDPEDQFHFL